MKLKVSTKGCIDKNGNTWEWEETEETRKALKQLHKSSAEVNLHKPPTKPNK
tara:strand:+ start:557 stop:712 length:156 start_codon:yes stop_codon:yes gene_type:complete